MKKSSAKDQVLEVIKNNSNCDTKTITEKVDYGQDTVRKACSKLVEEGLISKEEIKLTGALKKFLFNIKEETSRDTVNDAIKKAKESAVKSSEIRNKKVPKNREKVTFKGEELGKAKLVKAIIKSHVEENPKLTYSELAKLVNFDENGRRVYPKYDVIRPVTDSTVQKSFNGKSKRYYTKDILKSSDGIEFVICREWGMDNIDKDFVNPIAINKLNLNINTFRK